MDIICYFIWHGFHQRGSVNLHKFVAPREAEMVETKHCLIHVGLYLGPWQLLLNFSCGPHVKWCTIFFCLCTSCWIFTSHRFVWFSKTNFYLWNYFKILFCHLIKTDKVAPSDVFLCGKDSTRRWTIMRRYHPPFTATSQKCSVGLRSEWLWLSLDFIEFKKPVLGHLSFAAGCVILQKTVHCGHREMDVLSSNNQVGCGI